MHHAETFLFYPRFSCKQSWRRPLDEAANGDDDFIIVLKQAALWVVKCQEALQSISKNWIFHLKRSVNYSGKYNSLLIYGSWRLKIFLLNSPDRKWKKGWNGVKEYWLKRTFRSQLLNRSFIQLFFIDLSFLSFTVFDNHSKKSHFHNIASEASYAQSIRPFNFWRENSNSDF